MSPLWLAAWFTTLAAAESPPNSAASVEKFMTDTPPRVDPVFRDALTLRDAIDEFLGLQGEMERIRDGFATSIHQTLAKLPSKRGLNRTCPDGVGETYRRSYEAGTRYLKLGYKLRELYREIDRAEELGDAIALTPDYRLKAKKAQKIFEGLVRDYREMRVAFHDQLSTELKFAGCLPSSLMGPQPALAVDGPRDADASDPEAFDLEAADPADAEAPAGKSAKARGLPSNATPAAAGIWINLDNSRCTRPTSFAIDGIPMGEIPPKRRITLRTRAGTHELCILPEGDPRMCGEKGTVRRAYLYEGLTLTVHCEGK